MSRNTGVELGDEIAGFIDNQVTAGRYGSASEVIRAGVRRLQDQETKLEALRQAIKEGLDSGSAEAFDFEEFMTDRKARS